MIILQVHLVIHISAGILEDVRAFLTDEAANRYEEQLCKENEIPYEQTEREKYYDENEVDDDIE